MYEDLIETELSSERVYDGNLLHVKRDVVRLPNGHEAVREWITHPGASAVAPLTDEGELILVRQYRYPVRQVTLEVPAGKLDVAGESPLECAKRELAEETGYHAAKLYKLTTIATTVGFSNEYIHLFAAEGLTPGKQHPDDDEFINTVKVPLKDAVELINSGQITDAKTAVSILLLAQRK